MQDQKRMLNAREVSERLGVSTTTAYTVIRELNVDMAKRGCKTIVGRVSKDYFEEVFFGSGDERGDKDVR